MAVAGGRLCRREDAEEPYRAGRSTLPNARRAFGSGLTRAARSGLGVNLASHPLAFLAIAPVI